MGSKQKAHAREHVQRHIKGFSFDCKFCDKTFSKKESIRFHMKNSHEEVVHKQKTETVENEFKESEKLVTRKKRSNHEMIEFESKTTYYENQTDPIKTEYPITTLQIKEQKEEDYLDQSQPLNTNEDEYEEKVLELMIKIEDGWVCNKCP